MALPVARHERGIVRDELIDHVHTSNDIGMAAPEATEATPRGNELSDRSRSGVLGRGRRIDLRRLCLPPERRPDVAAPLIE